MIRSLYLAFVLFALITVVPACDGVGDDDDSSAVIADDDDSSAVGDDDDSSTVGDDDDSSTR